MAKIRFFNTNYWESGVCSASSSVPALPAGATQDYQRTSPWRSVAEAAPWIKVDIGSAQAVNAGALADVQVIEGSLASTVLQWSTDDVSWTTFATVGAPNDETHVAAVVAATQTKRYWRYLFTAGGGTVVIQVGKVFVGSYLEPATRNFRIPLDLPLTDPSIVVASLDGQRSIIRRSLYYSGSWKIEGIPAADRDALIAMVRTVRGPIFVTFNDAVGWGTLLAHHGPATFAHTMNVNAAGVPNYWIDIPFEEAR